jgi:hypothetical protein
MPGMPRTDSGGPPGIAVALGHPSPQRPAGRSGKGSGSFTVPRKSSSDGRDFHSSTFQLNLSCFRH